MADLASGTMIDGRYKVHSRLGAGGMADVFLAEDEQLGRKIALKLLHRRFAEDPGFVERFRREAQAAAGLQHPNVVSVYDRGSYDDTYYIAMEYLPGRTLKQLIRDEAPIEPVRAIDITIQILKAARFAHRRGVIHRDLKPHNVIVDDSDHAKVTDFGIARAGASDMTETGSIMGTAQYLSPEQAQGHSVSASSDLYSIAVVLYELLTGRVPFDAEAAVTIALKHVSEAPTAPTALNSSIPTELEQIVMWGLNKNPADRPQDADQFIVALEHAKTVILSGVGGQRTTSMAALAAVGALVDAPPPADVPGGPSDPQGSDGVLVGDGSALPPHEPEAPPPQRRRRWWPWALLLVLLLAGGGVAAYLLTRPVKSTVPTVVLQPLNTARTEVQNAGLNLSVINVADKHPAGIVIAQSPLGGTKVDQGSTVTLTVSQGPGNATVPSVKGLTLAQAQQKIRQVGLTPGRVVSLTSTQFPAGQVTDTDPTAGQTPPVGTTVTIFVSSGKPQVTVPDVTGQPEAAARATLSSRGFKVTTSDQTSSTITPGTVISQSPAGGQNAASGSTVNLVIARAPASVNVPSVAGSSAASARATLTAAGFAVTETPQTVTSKAKNGVVLSQDPTPGSPAKKGSTVTIVVGHYKAPPTPTTPTGTTTTPGTTTP
jgi:eukaryotic-like serine/threonine-protein kinase